MTRESKLALMIAVTLILLVGVLLSDHLSGATKTEFDAPPVAERTVAPVVDLPGAGIPAQALARHEPAPVPEPEPAFEFEPEPVVISQAPASERQLFTEALRGVDEAFGRIQEAPALIGTGLFKPVADEAVTLPPRDPRGDQPVKPVAEPERSEPAPVTRRAEPETPVRWETHTVVAGDSLYRLAARYLGDGNRWRDLQRLNADQLGADGETLRVGTVLKIAQSRGAAPAPAKPAVAAPREYVVLKGDALSLISQKLLGSSRRMKEIIELNGLKDADDIRVGQTLKIPAK